MHNCETALLGHCLKYFSCFGSWPLRIGVHQQGALFGRVLAIAKGCCHIWIHKSWFWTTPVKFDICSSCWVPTSPIYLQSNSGGLIKLCQLCSVPAWTLGFSRCQRLGSHRICLNCFYTCCFKGGDKKQLISYFTLDYSLFKSRKLMSYTTYSESVDAKVLTSEDQMKLSDVARSQIRPATECHSHCLSVLRPKTDPSTLHWT